MSFKNCSKVLRSKAGVGLLPVVLGLSAVSVATVAVVSQMGLSSLRRSVSALSEWETNLFNQKALSLGGYFIAHNLVLCREDGWAAHGGNSSPIKCIWGGDMHEPRITTSSFDVNSVRHNSLGGLELEVENTDAVGKTVLTKLEFQLIDWTQNPSFRTLVGTIPAWNGLADDDNFMVTMSATTMLSLDSQNAKPILKVGAIRRPLGTPDLQVLSNAGGSVCTFECEAGDTLSPHPECRGPLQVPPGGASATVTARMTNFGPGAIYKLRYVRTTAFDQSVYPGRPEQVEVVDAMNGREVIMPGQVVSRDLPRLCFSPIRNFMTTSVEQVATGEQATTTVNTEVSVASSFRNLSRERFEVSVSRFEPSQMLDANFVVQYDPFNPATYQPNLTQSIIEPKRLGAELPAFEVESPQEIINETTTTVVVRPRLVESFPNSDGGGDGDN